MNPMTGWGHLRETAGSHVRSVAPRKVRPSGMKSAVLLQLICLAAGLIGALAGGVPASCAAELEKSPTEASYFDRERYRRIASEQQERYRKRVPIPDAVGEKVQVAAFARPPGDGRVMNSRVSTGNRLQVLLLGAACILAGALTLFLRLFPHFATGVGLRLNPWTLSPVTAAGFSAKVRAEEDALSEFVVAFRLGPQMAPSTAVSPGGSPVSSISEGQPSEVESRLEHDPVAMFLFRAPELLGASRKLIKDIVGVSDTTARQKMLGDLLGQIGYLKGEAGIPEMLPAWQMACALEGLLKQLTDKMSNTTHSTLRTVAGGLEMLEELCQPGVRVDLCADPPFRLLAVDDDPISRRAITFALKRGLNEPNLAENGDEALALASRLPYEVIFLDVQMPGMDGFELCSEIHHATPNQSTPVVFVTCQSDFDARAQSVLCGGNDLIGKPFLTFEITVKALTLALGARLANGKARLEAANRQSLTGLLPEPAGARKVHDGEISTERGLGERETWPSTNERTVKSSATHSLPGVDCLPDPGLRQRDVPACAKPGRTHAVNLFYTQAPARLLQLERQFHAARHAPDAAIRQELFGELSAAVLLFIGQTESAALSSTQRLGSALEALLRKLHQRADYCTPTALDACNGALDLLRDLCQSRVEPDLSAPSLRILVVDDDLIARRAFAGAVQVAFGRPDSAPNGEVALALACEKSFDVIFLDVHMPGMDGCTTCERIHQTQANRVTPVVFVTGQNDLEARSHAARSGGCGFIPKPVLASEIALTALTFALRGRLSQPRFAHAQDPAVWPRAAVNADQPVYQEKTV
jgi:CheY-like chemotaxis protein